MNYKFKAIGVPIISFIILLLVWAVAAIVTTTVSVGQSSYTTNQSITEVGYNMSPGIYQPPQIFIIFGKIFNHVPLISLIMFLIFLTNGIILSRKATKHSKLMTSDPATYTPYFLHEVTLIKKNAGWTFIVMMVLIIITACGASTKSYSLSENDGGYYNSKCQPVFDPTLNNGLGDFVIPPGC